MEFVEFFQRFGGSCRVKHIPARGPHFDSFLTRLRSPSKRKIDPFKGSSYDGRTYIADHSELPRHFIKLDPWEAEYLFILASRSKRGILETGRMRGGSTFLLACANDRVPIHSIDIAPIDDQKLLALLAQFDVGDKVDLIVGDSQKTKYAQVGEIDLLWIDADHSYEGCKRDIENWYPNLIKGGHVVLHDCYYGSPVQEAVIDFMAENHVEVIQSPYILSTHWRHPCGSLAHFIKRG